MRKHYLPYENMNLVDNFASVGQGSGGTKATNYGCFEVPLVHLKKEKLINR